LNDCPELVFPPKRESLVPLNPKRGTWRGDALAGALGGLTGGLCGFPGAFVTIWCGMRGWTKEAQRAIYQPYILAMQLAALACLGFQAPGAIAAEAFVVYVPLALVAASLGLAVFRRLSTRQFALAGARPSH